MNSASVVIYPSMQCAFRGGTHCPYCWVDYREEQTGVQAPLGWERWRDFLLRLPPSVVDVAGGEPLQYPGLYELLASIAGKHEWALTTNLLNTRNYRRLVEEPLAGCVHITWSYHPFSPQDQRTWERFRRLREVYGPVVTASVVRWGNIPVGEIVRLFEAQGVPCAVNDYQPPQGNQENDVWQRCNGGHRHIVVDADGTVYPCFAFFELRRGAIGHIDSFQFAPVKALCRQECGPCYRAPGNPFRIDLEPAEAPVEVPR
ncbi:MAG: radical SAM/SPASM domain-containing protein [Chloroflexi bacterium]|nr:radical SAM/SPASM domain-containing protein [Chloroflexota bacterium]